jgi:hypothetical protein
MGKAIRLWTIVSIFALALLLAGPAPLLRAQDSNSYGPTLRLYVDPKTHIVYTEPGRGRVLLAEIPASALDATHLEQRQQKTEEQLEQTQRELSNLQSKNQTLEISNRDLNQQMAEIRPAWRNYIDNFQDKFRVGALFFGDYRFYSLTGFQPQELTQLTNPGPGNNNYNSFDITRTYLNFYFFPTKDWTLRLTPNMYKTIGCNTSATPCTDNLGNTTTGSNSFSSNLDGDFGVRMKYAYIQYSNLWKNVPLLKGGTITLGEIPNPLVAWEEDLYGYRFVNLTPWNYYSLSSTQVGMSMEGLVKPGGGETAYLDYGFGVYNNASFHAFEQSENKQVMGRLTAYPFGADWRFQGLGLTGFYDYGYGNTTPDNMDIPTPLKATNAHFDRIAALVHFSQPLWNLVGEFDYGQNAFNLANLFSGDGPSDAFGIASGSGITANNTGSQVLTGAPLKGSFACSATTPCYNAYGSYGPQTAVWRAILQNGRERNIGVDFFGHLNIPYTKFTLFGMFQWFMPNDNVTEDPLDFQRFVVGVSYQYNEYLRFAIDSQNLSFYHNQFGIPVGIAEGFGYAPGSFNGRQLPSLKGYTVPNLVPSDTHSIFANVEFAY